MWTADWNLLRYFLTSTIHVNKCSPAIFRRRSGADRVSANHFLFAGVVNDWRECKTALRTVEDKTGIIYQYTHGGADGCFTVPIEELQII